MTIAGATSQAVVMRLHQIAFLIIFCYLLKSLLQGASLCLHFHQGEAYCINLTHVLANNMSSSGAEIYYEPTGCNCDGTSYSKSSINAAASKALELASQGQTLGTMLFLLRAATSMLTLA